MGENFLVVRGPCAGAESVWPGGASPMSVSLHEEEAVTDGLQHNLRNIVMYVRGYRGRRALVLFISVKKHSPLCMNAAVTGIFLFSKELADYLDVFLTF